MCERLRTGKCLWRELSGGKVYLEKVVFVERKLLAGNGRRLYLLKGENYYLENVK